MQSEKFQVLVTDISLEEVRLFQQFIRSQIGVELGKNSQQLLVSRLAPRILQLELDSFATYFQFITNTEGKSIQEDILCIDLLTTNETYFFREQKQLNFFKEYIGTLNYSQISVWSAACSSGEECYSIAMILANEFGFSPSWRVFGSDISARMIAKAKRAIYQDVRTDFLPKEFRLKYLMHSKDLRENKITVVPELKKNVEFFRHNLLNPLPSHNEYFNFIFCRNVMIYFDNERRQQVLRHLLLRLKPGGLLFVGLSESLRDLQERYLEQIGPSTYMKKSNCENTKASVNEK